MRARYTERATGEWEERARASDACDDGYTRRYTYRIGDRDGEGRGGVWTRTDGKGRTMVVIGEWDAGASSSFLSRADTATSYTGGAGEFDAR